MMRLSLGLHGTDTDTGDTSKLILPDFTYIEDPWWLD
jgi:hypothetical protein